MHLSSIKNFLLGTRRLLSVVAFILLWEIAPRTGLADSRFLPPFSEVFITLVKLIYTGELIGHILISLQRALIGFSLGLLIAIPLGILIGWFKKFDYYTDALLQTFRQTSTLSLLPVFMLIFGIGEVSKVAIVFWGVQWAIILNTITGVKNIDTVLIKSARSMGASPLTLFFKVIFPAAFPTIFTGIRLSATNSILVLVAAEMLGASKGLGFLIFDAEVKYQIPKMFAAILTMAMLGLILNYILVSIEKRITRWKEELPVGN